MATDFNEIWLTAMDTVVKKRLESIQFDYTNTYTITDATNAAQGQYTVTDGNIEFLAYSTDTNYKVDDVVYVTIPNNDFNQQKLIVGKQVTDDTTPFVFTHPFDSIVDVSTNLITSAVDEKGLTANEPKTADNANAEEVLLWERDLSEAQIAGFTRLGLQGQFKTWLQTVNTVEGQYGLRLDLTSIQDSKGSIVAIYNKCYKYLTGALTNAQWDWIINTAGKDNDINDWIGFTEQYGYSLPSAAVKNTAGYEYDAVTDLKEYITNQLQTISYEYYSLYFSNKDMYGNTYNFESFYQQEQVFDISNLGRIIYMKLYLYQIPHEEDEDGNVTVNGFLDQDKQPIAYQDFLGNVLAHNIFIKDPYVCVGYDIRNFEKDQVILYTLDSSTYASNTQLDNGTDTESGDQHKQIQLRWIHQLEDGSIVSVNESDNNNLQYTINWYRHSLGASTQDAYSGIDWTLVNTGTNFSYDFDPNVKLEYEQIKAVILYNNEPYYSNILTFTNESSVPDYATLDVANALNLWCDDKTYGNYRVYDQGNSLLDADDGQQIRDLTCYFNAHPTDGEETSFTRLTEATFIKWRIPASSTMIQLDTSNKDIAAFDITSTTKKLYTEKSFEEYSDTDFESVKYSIGNLEFEYTGEWTGYMYDEANDEVVIVWRGDQSSGEQINPSLEYRISNYYDCSATRNTISCTVYRNKQTYESTKEFTFGVAGTTGTDYTLVIDFDNNQNALTCFSGVDITAVPEKDKRNISFTARLYDYSNKEIDIHNATDLSSLTYTWSWHQDSYGSDKHKLINYSANLSTESILKQKIGTGTEHYNADPNRITLEDCTKAEMSDLLYLTVTLSGWGDYDLTAVLPVPIRKYIDSTHSYTHITGATSVIYQADGYPHYYSNSYEIYYRTNTSDSLYSISKYKKVFAIYNPNNEAINFIGSISTAGDGSFLQPAGIYADGVQQYGVQYKDSTSGVVYWTQPIYTAQNLYPSNSLNKWDGKSLELDYDNGTIIANGIAAGLKNDDNTFSGVMLGDWSSTNAAEEITAQTGIYGFNHGAMSYAFKDDGTAFIGKAGGGRINFDGTDSTIKNEAYDLDVNPYGMCLDLDDGFIDIIGANDITHTTSDQSNAAGTGYKSTITTYTPTGAGIKIRSDGAPYFRVTADNTHNTTNLIEMSNTEYYLQSYDYQEDDTTAGTKGKGLRLDLLNSYLKAYDFTLEGYSSTTGAHVRLSSFEEPYFEVDCKHGTPLIYAGDSDYYIQSCGFTEPAGDSFGSGLKLCLGSSEKDNDYYLHAYGNFELKAGSETGQQIILQSDDGDAPLYVKGKGLASDSTGLATDYYLEKSNGIGSSVGTTFQVSWDGKLQAKYGAIGAWNFYSNEYWSSLWSHSSWVNASSSAGGSTTGNEQDDSYTQDLNEDYYMFLDPGRDFVFAAGISATDFGSDHSKAPFRIMRNGKAYLTGAEIKGGELQIGNWVIDKKGITAYSDITDKTKGYLTRLTPTGDLQLTSSKGYIQFGSSDNNIYLKYGSYVTESGGSSKNSLLLTSNFMVEGNIRAKYIYATPDEGYAFGLYTTSGISGKKYTITSDGDSVSFISSYFGRSGYATFTNEHLNYLYALASGYKLHGFNYGETQTGAGYAYFA